MAKIHGPDSIPDTHAALMGHLANAWAEFEFEIDQGIWALTNTAQQLSACITSQLISAHPRMKAFIALVEVRGGSKKTIDALKRFNGNTVSGLAEMRNRRIHDPRYKDRATGNIHRLEITAKPAVQFGFLPEPAKELEDIIGDIWKCIDGFISLRNSVLSEIDALPPESRPQLRQIVAVRTAPKGPSNG